MNAPAPVQRGRYRHKPNEPRTLVATMTERTSAAGERYFYGFEPGEKFFMIEDRAQPGRWLLYAQDLASPDVVPELSEPVRRGPHGGELVTWLPDGPLRYVSGLPSDFLGRRR